MACSGAYATTWEYAAELCIHPILAGYDDSGGAGNPTLTDSAADFINGPATIDVGHWCKNITDGSEGPITARTETTVTATLAGGTTNLWSSGDLYQLMPITVNERAIIQMYLDTAASDVHASLAATGACDCALASWATQYLKKLNIYDAAVRHNCPCGSPTLSQELKSMWLDWINTQLGLLRKGEIEVCAGATGADFPAIGVAEQGVTDWTRAQIIWNSYLRSG